MTLSLLAHALALVAQPRMGLFDSLPGFWKVACPPGYARASHCLFLGTDDAAKQKALTATDRAKRALELDRAALLSEPRTCDRCRRAVAAPNPQRGGARVAKKASDRFATRR